MKVKELIEKLKEFDGETDVVIRFAVSSQDDIGYVLTQKIIDEYLTSVAIYANYEHTAEDCAFMGQVDLKQAYENELRRNEVIDINSDSIEKDIKILENFLQMAYVDSEKYYKQIEIGDMTFDAIKNLLLGYKKYKNMYEAEHRIHLVRNEQLSRKEKAIIKCKGLERENEELKELHTQDNKHLDFLMEHSIPVQKVKEKIEKLKNELKYIGCGNSDCNKCFSKYRGSNFVYCYAYHQIKVLQELLESEE